jgi:hypothetical protein
LIHYLKSGRTNLLLGGGLGEVGEGLAALELGILDHTWGKEVLVHVFDRYGV